MDVFLLDVIEFILQLYGKVCEIRWHIEVEIFVYSRY